MEQVRMPSWQGPLGAFFRALFKAQARPLVLSAKPRRPIVGEDPVILNLNIGTALKNLGKRGEAKTYLRKCLELNPQYAQCRQRLNEIGG